MHTYEFRAQAQGQFGGSGLGFGWDDVTGAVKDAASATAGLAVTTTAAALTGGASLAYQASTQTLTKPFTALKTAIQDTCGLVANPGVQQATTVAASVPNGYSQGAAQGVATANTVCQLVNGPTPVKTPVKSFTFASNLVPKYPKGSIAYFDGSAYRVAKPIATLNGFGPTYAEAGVETKPPVGVTLVSKSQYQKVVYPWYKRTNVLLSIAGVAAAGSAGFYFFRKR